VTTFNQAAESIVTIGRYCYQRGWLPATSGNISVRLDDQALALTKSGKNKGELAVADIMQVDMQGQPLSEGKPSAETLLHCQLYGWQADIGAVIHTHSPAATTLSVLARGALIFEQREILKAFPGIESHENKIEIPVFNNDQNMPRLARQVEAYMAESHRHFVAYLIRGHGLYTWGTAMHDAQRHLEALEFLFECQLLMGRTQR